MVAHSYHSKFAKDFTIKTFKMNRFFNENVKQKISISIKKNKNKRLRPEKENNFSQRVCRELQRNEISLRYTISQLSI